MTLTRIRIHPQWFIFLSCAVGFLVVAPLAGAQAPPAKPNILFIAVDDLNHWVRHLGHNPQAITPNLDRLAARGVTFTRAYCAAPACNPSRAALMSGLRPSTSGVYDNPTDWRPHIDESLGLTNYLRKNGYVAIGAGKIYHGNFNRRTDWDQYFTRQGTPAAEVREPKPQGNAGVGGIKFAPLDCRDDELIDYHITNFAIEQLGRKHDKPFFLACGLHKPHMPWNVPRKYFDMYPLDKIELPRVSENDLADVPPAGVRMAGPDGDHAQMLASGRWREAVQAYLATITYCDMNIGRLLDALDKSPHKDNTIIVLWGDHGWHLGEKQHWRKFALWEEATRMPFIWVAPGLTKPGTRCDTPVDLMSVYPTLCELAGLPIPKHVEGVSIKPLLGDPQADWKTPALTTHGFNNHAIRTKQWRFIHYNDGGEELYDHHADPLEWDNLASKEESAPTRAELTALLPKTNKPAPQAPARQRQQRARPQ